jgi:hypothetical protein
VKTPWGIVHLQGVLIDFSCIFALCLDDHFGYIKNSSTTTEPSTLGRLNAELLSLGEHRTSIGNSFSSGRQKTYAVPSSKGFSMQSSDRRLRVPAPQGLYHPRNEHDACGMGLVASIRGEKSHEIIRKGLEVLINLTHRGAAGCDPETGDGSD